MLIGFQQEVINGGIEFDKYCIKKVAKGGSFQIFKINEWYFS